MTPSESAKQGHSEAPATPLLSQIHQSIIRVDNVDTPRNRVRAVAHTIWLHLHPAKLPRHGVRVSYTWGAGGISFLLFLVTVATGLFLMFVYRPTPEHAYLDMKYLDFDVPFGMHLRNLHRWSAHLMVLIVWAHMLRVFLTGSYKAPRQFNWVIGVLLMTMTMLLSFTGYLLPWDQLSMWAVTVGTNMAAATPFLGHEGPGASILGVTQDNDLRAALLGGSTVGGPALLRFYILHCIALPMALSLGLIVHFWRVRRDGGISGPERGSPEE
ncbi:MAG: cytochrome b N-terminal domain-containing protein [Deltaproteobacteria bacterium]|nr:cytochrome b N-terminal domain-containing protein [Deltaproteobacteria bacterium]